ncbi:MAG TPA: VWA domain-containing protein, partial [Bryobacteraceae bacterium]
MHRTLPIVALCAVAWAQTAPQQSEPHPIRVEVNEVIVPVTVTDYKNRFISNLDRSDFSIYENGREQKVAYFNAEHNQPVVVGFLLDLSSSSRVHWNNFEESAKELVWTLLSEDKAKKYSGFLVTYGTEAELAVDSTNDPDAITDKISKVKPGGGSALYDAIYLAITKHKQVRGEPIEPRRVLIVIGNGNDNASKYTIDQVIELAQRHLVTIYGVSTTSYGFTSEGDAGLRRMAEETGGRVEYPLQGVYDNVDGHLSKPQDAGNYAITVESGGYAGAVATKMFQAIANIAGEVTTQYILRYTPENPDLRDPHKYRSITVQVN